MNRLSALLVVGVAFYSGLAPAGQIRIDVADIADLSDYLNDPLFTPYFESDATIIDFEGP